MKMTTRIEDEKKNVNWHLLEINENGWHVLDNPKRQYTMLVNAVTNQYVVAYKYNPDDNTWEQGHYFDNLHRALEFMILGE